MTYYWCLEDECLCEVEPYLSQEDLDTHMEEEHNIITEKKLQEKYYKKFLEERRLFKFVDKYVDDLIKKVIHQ
jgi:hypothetical protein